MHPVGFSWNLVSAKVFWFCGLNFKWSNSIIWNIHIYYYKILCSSKKFSSHKCSFYHWIQQVNFSLILLRPLPYFNSPFFQTKKSFQKVCKRRASTIMTSYFYSSYIKCTKRMVHIWICFNYIPRLSWKVLYTSFSQQSVVSFVYKY